MARGRRSNQDTTTLQMALVGYEIERKKIEERIGEILSRLGRSSPGQEAAAPKKRVMSAAARRRISAAQKRRWALQRKNAKKG